MIPNVLRFSENKSKGTSLYPSGLFKSCVVAIRSATEAKEKAREAGAVENTIEIMEINENPLAYLPGRSVRLQIKAIGDLENI